MASSKALLLLGILFATLLLVSESREMVEKTQENKGNEAGGVEDQKYGGYGPGGGGYNNGGGYPGGYHNGGGYNNGGGYPGGYHNGGGYPGGYHNGGGYNNGGGYPGGYHNGGGYNNGGGYPGYHNGGGYNNGGGHRCFNGCCRRGYYGGCQCCSSPNEIPDREYQAEGNY